MLLLITPDRHDEFVDDLIAMHRLRYRVFKTRLDWEVEAVDDMEVDSFDALRPSYLLLRGPNNTVSGCVRLGAHVGPSGVPRA